MAQYTAEVFWSRDQQDFLDNRYSRRHVLRFDGGIELPGSSSPHVIPVPRSDPSAVDPEEMFVASLSSCHMLSFLSIAAQRKFVVDHYVDKAVGVLQKNAAGQMSMSHVTLHPETRFAGKRVPSRPELVQMHHEAHEACYIANSVTAAVRCEPV